MSKPAKLVQCEIVRVACPHFLVNSRRHACRYESADGAVLADGYYLALWPARACRSSYGHEVRYFGPYQTEAVARMMQLSALCLGLVAPGAERGDDGSLDPARANPHYHPDGPRCSIPVMSVSLRIKSP